MPKLLQDNYKIFLIETLEDKPHVVAATPIWIILNDDIANFNLKDYLPIETNPRKIAKRRSGGAAFSFGEGIDYELMKKLPILNDLSLK